jgi:AcrR family transcriptional regulator
MSGAAETVRARRRAPRSEQKLELLLGRAAALMARQGYESTAIRDVAREMGCSLAGMYYYFRSKEDLLYQIQLRTFASLVEAHEAAIAAGGPPQERLRRIVRGHLEFFANRRDELKVCTYEMDSLKGELFDEVQLIRRRYFKMLAGIVGELMGRSGPAPRDIAVRHATMFVFGMLNWIFMWFDAERDAPIEALADEMTDFVLAGLRHGPPATPGGPRP